MNIREARIGIDENGHFHILDQEENDWLPLSSLNGISYALYYGEEDPVTIPNGNSVPLPIASLGEGEEILDLSDGIKFRESGLYLVIATVATDSLTDPDHLTLVNVYGSSMGAFSQNFVFDGTHYFQATCVAIMRINAQDPLLLQIRNDDGASRDVSSLNCKILKLA